MIAFVARRTSRRLAVAPELLAIGCAGFLSSALVLGAPRAFAGTPADYAYGWPLELAGESGAWQVDLTPEVYAVVQDEALRDVEIFDGSGRPVPVAPFALEPEPLPGSRIALPVFALRRAPGGEAFDLRVQVARGDDRAIHRVDAQLASAGESRAGPSDYLLDASRIDIPMEALWLRWAPAAGDAKASFAVEASDDLERWRTIVASATVLELHGEGETLVRQRIDLPRTRAAYLRLRALAPHDLRELGVEAQLESVGVPAPPRRWLETTLASQHVEEGSGGEKRGVHVYETGAAYPVDAIRILPRGAGSLARIQVAGEAPDGRWLARASFTLVGVAHGDERVQRSDAPLSPGPRTMRWRIEAVPPLDAPPQVLVALRPDRFAFLPQGEPPFLLAAGSHVAKRTDAPMEAAIAELRSRLGAAWRPPLAALGARRALAGETALAAPLTPIPWTRIFLWAVLLAGAGLVAGLAIRLLRRGAA
ncbi:MAG TPA: DUF3999 family protein [Vulgatibacter sp.]